MYCKNCGNEVNEKAVACLKCGVNPQSEKNFCPSCGVSTNPNQVICTKCGVSLASKSFSIDTTALQNIDVNAIIKNKTLIAAAIALIGFFFTWVNYTANVYGKISMHFSGSSLSDFLKQYPQISTILSPMLLWLFPLCLIGIIVADFVPQITKYKKHFSIASLVLIIYAAIGIFTMSVDMPEMNEMQKSIVGKMDVSFSAGWGFYLSLLATLASAYFSGLLSKNKLNIDTSIVQNVNVGGLLKNKMVLGIAALAIISYAIYFFVFNKSDARKLAELGCKSAKMVQEMNLINTSVEDIKKFQEEHQKELAEMQQEVVLIQNKYTGDKEFMKEYAEEIQKMDDCPDDVKKAVKSLLKW